MGRKADPNNIIEAEIAGEKAIRMAIQHIQKPATRNKIMRPAIGAAASAVSKAAKRNAPKETGLLQKSIGSRTITDKRTAMVSGVVGPRRGFKQRVRRSRSWASSTPANPLNYAHLVEFGSAAGTRVYKKGPLKGRSRQHPGNPPQPFMRPAMDQTNHIQIIQKRAAVEFIRQQKLAAAKGRSLK